MEMLDNIIIAFLASVSVFGAWYMIKNIEEF